VNVSVGSITENPQRSKFVTYNKYLKSVRQWELKCTISLYTSKAACDTIDRTRLYLATEEMQIRKKFVNLVSHHEKHAVTNKNPVNTI
jgi:hypothetical protein